MSLYLKKKVCCIAEVIKRYINLPQILQEIILSRCTLYLEDCMYSVGSEYVPLSETLSVFDDRQLTSHTMSQTQVYARVTNFRPIVIKEFNFAKVRA